MLTRPLRRSSAAVAVAASAALILGQIGALAPASASEVRPLPSSTSFFTPPAPTGAAGQISRLRSSGRPQDAALVQNLVDTPQAVWFTSGTPASVAASVRRTVKAAAAQSAVPTMVVYNVPGRDCSQYSSGGAGSDTAYQAWADGFASGLTSGQRAVVVIEPDGLANLPSDCPAAYPGQDVEALTRSRIADITYAGQAVLEADPDALVYLDAGHSAWHSVGDMAQRLDQAGVSQFQGFSLNVSNYQPTRELAKYGNWISKCLYYAGSSAHSGQYSSCASQYYPATPTDFSTWHLTDEWYAANVDNAAGAPTSTSQLAHFVVDTSRNGRGPWTPTATYPDPQTWCNPPRRGAGLRPSADTGRALLDAFLWIKTPGQSDGQCNRGVAGSPTDPEWGGITDPAAGAWFPQQALQLAKLAVPPLR